MEALVTGGTVTFTQNCSITLTSPLLIDADTTIDTQGHTVSLLGDTDVNVMEVPVGVTFTAIGLTFLQGQSTNGGAIYVNEGATVILTNCIFGGNTAKGTDGDDGADGRNSSSTGGSGGPGTAGLNGLGGAIYNLGTVTAYKCTFATNSASGGAGGAGGAGGNGGWQAGAGGRGGAGGLAQGGAIYSAEGAETVLLNCTFSSNTTKGGAGGAGGDGGDGDNRGDGGNGGAGGMAAGSGIYNLGMLVLSGSTFPGNTAAGGTGGSGGTEGAGFFAGLVGSGAAGGRAVGAAVCSHGQAEVEGCLFTDSKAQGGDSASGGMVGTGDGASGPKGADGLGGAVYMLSGGVTNCTFTGNKAYGGKGGAGGSSDGGLGGDGGDGGTGAGGGIYGLSGSTLLLNCTLTQNGAYGGTNGAAGTGTYEGSAGSKGASRGGNVARGSGTFILQNSIIVTNLSGGNGYGGFTDAGCNISSDSSIAFGGTSYKNKDPRIGTLASNGGPTKTFALLSGSFAIDRVTSGEYPETDQRGVPRPSGNLADIGAYEVSPPFISDGPADVVQTNGGSVTFAVTVVGDSPLTYRWSFNNSLISGAAGSSYTITKAGNTNAGNYFVIATNSYGAVTSRVATLTVTQPPLIVTQPTNVDVLVGGSAVFTVQASGDSPLSYQWYFNGTNSLSGATSNVYAISSVTTSSAGNYSVRITNAFGYITSTAATLTVKVPPTITVQPADTSVSLGKAAKFTVTAEGTAPLTYRWYHNDIDTGATAATYSISSVGTNDAGRYYVQVTGSGVTIRSREAQLTVLPPAVQFSPIQLQSGKVNLNLLGVSGYQYEVQYREAVSQGNWITLTNFSGAGTNVIIAEPATNLSRFYRAIVR